MTGEYQISLWPFLWRPRAKISKSNRNPKTATNTKSQLTGVDLGWKNEKHALRMALMREKASKTRYWAWYVSVETAYSQHGCSTRWH